MDNTAQSKNIQVSYELIGHDGTTLWSTHFEESADGFATISRPCQQILVQYTFFFSNQLGCWESEIHTIFKRQTISGLSMRSFIYGAPAIVHKSCLVAI